MTRGVLAALAMTLGVTAAQAADYVIKEKKIGRQRITVIDPVTPPPVVGLDSKAKANVTPGTLATKDWKCGMCFTDQNDRKWCLACGQAFCDKPDRLTGWLLQARDGHLLFITEFGCLFKQMDCLPGGNRIGRFVEGR